MTVIAISPVIGSSGGKIVAALVRWVALPSWELKRVCWAMGHDDEDGWKLAVVLVNRYGIGAFDEAERRAKAALDAEDVMAHSIWLGVAKAVLELTRPASEEDAVN